MQYAKSSKVIEYYIDKFIKKLYDMGKRKAKRYKNIVNIGKEILMDNSKFFVSFR